MKLFTYDNQIAVQYKTGVNESVVDIYSYSDSGEIKCKLDANVRTTDLHRDGDIFCELFYAENHKGMDRMNISLAGR